MSIRKIVALCLATNLLCFALLVGVFAVTQTAGAQAPSLVGPFYYAMSTMDFQPYDDTYYSLSRAGLALYRTSDANPTIGVAAVHLPNGANITELYLDAEDNSGSGDVTIRLLSCPLGTSGCATRAVLSSLDGGCGQATGSLNYTVNSQSEALFVQADFNGTRPQLPNVFLYFVRLAYYVPAPTFLPIIQR